MTSKTYICPMFEGVASTKLKIEALPVIWSTSNFQEIFISKLSLYAVRTMRKRDMGAARTMRRRDLGSWWGNEMFPASPAVNYSEFRICGHGHSFLSSYLCRIKLKENTSCNACGHQLQDLMHLLLVLSRIWTFPARHLWHYFFHFWSLVQTLSVARLLGLHGIPLCPHPSAGEHYRHYG